MKKYTLFFILFFQLANAQVSVLEDSLYSPSLDNISKFNVILPDGYSNSQDRYPVLYLLHGYSGDYTNWVKLTNLVTYAKDHRLIIIMPDGKNSWYANSIVLPHANYEDFIMNDLMKYAESKYRIIQSKYNRAVAGLSMGGLGAVKFGIKYPSKFFFAAGLSPAIQFPMGLEDSIIVSRRSKGSNQSVRDAFGPTRSDFWNENDVFYLAEKANAKTAPYFYLAVGSQDGIPEIIDFTHLFAATLRKQGISFEMHETAGGHEWKFWDKEIKMVLDKMSELNGKLESN